MQKLLSRRGSSRNLLPQSFKGNVREDFKKSKKKPYVWTNLLFFHITHHQYSIFGIYSFKKNLEINDFGKFQKIQEKKLFKIS